MLPEAGAFEIVFLAAVALIVVGPKDLPVLLRKIGQFTAKMRGLAAEFRASFDEMARQSELDELRKEVDALRNGQFASSTTAELHSHVGEINSHLNGSYWDASSHGAETGADPVQTFIDPQTGLILGEGEETAALPPPGSATPPLPIKTPRKRAAAGGVAADGSATPRARASAKPRVAIETSAKAASKAVPRKAGLSGPAEEASDKRAPKASQAAEV